MTLLFLLRIDLSNISAKSDRTISIKLANCIFINVYSPAVNCVSYDDIMTELVGIIDGNLSENLGCNIVLGGDFKLEFVNDLSQCQIFNNFVKAARPMLCDSRVVSSTEHTYLYQFCSLFNPFRLYINDDKLHVLLCSSCTVCTFCFWDTIN